MRKNHAAVALAATAVLCAACGGGEESGSAEAAARPSVIGDPLQRSLERAQAVQDTVDERAQALRRQLEAQE